MQNQEVVKKIVESIDGHGYSLDLIRIRTVVIDVCSGGSRNLQRGVPIQGRWSVSTS